jgi:PAS domain S-box-containing protein
MKSLLNNSRHFLLLLVSFCVILNLLIWRQVGQQINSDREGTIQTAIQHHNNLAVSLEQAAIRTIGDADAALSLVKFELEKQGKVDFSSLLQHRLLDLELFDGLAVIDSAGKIVNTFPDQQNALQVDVADRAYFQVHKHFRDSLFISTPLQSRTINKPVIVISRKITNREGKFYGVVAIQVTPPAFMSFYRKASINEFDILSLISPEGITYSRRTGAKESSGEDIHKSPLFSHVKDSAVGNYQAKDAIRGLPTFFSYRKLENYPIIATVGRREEDVLARFYDRRNREIGFGFVLSFVLVIFFYSVFVAFSLKRKSLKAIRKSEVRYRSIFENSRDAILLLDPEGKIEAINDAACAMFKIHLKDTEQSFAQLFQSSLPNNEFTIEAITQLPEDQREFQFTCFDESRFIGELAYSHFYDADQQKHTMILLRDITQRRTMERRHQEEQKRYQRNLTRQIIVAQERERESIGHELHDNVNQILTTVKLYLETALKLKDKGDELVHTSISHVQHCIHEIRNLSHSLSAPTLGTKSLVDSISVLIENVSQCTPIDIQFQFHAYKNPICKEQSLALYRIAQEQLTNIIKHAQASVVLIDLRQAEDKKTYLTITDNGKGFDIKAQPKGIGLKNIASRIQAFHGQFFVYSNPGEGCTLTVTLPWGEFRDAKPVKTRHGIY